MQMKQCTQCPNSYPATKEYFVAEKKSPDGLMAMCKTCRNVRKKKWDDDNREKVREQKRESAMRHREKNNERSRRWLQNPKNVETARARTRQHYRDHRAEKIDYAARYYRNNKQSLIRQSLEYARNRRATDPEYAMRLRTNVINYRARKHKAEGEYTPQEFQSQIESQGGRCMYCGGEMKPPTADHYIPLFHGGANHIGNIVAACHSCNSSKKDRMPWQWDARLTSVKPRFTDLHN